MRAPRLYKATFECGHEPLGSAYQLALFHRVREWITANGYDAVMRNVYMAASEKGYGRVVAVFVDHRVAVMAKLALSR